MYDYHGFPEWANAHLEADKSTRMSILENGMRGDLSVAVRPKFIPYVQLHEFEALVYSDHAVFSNYYSPSEFAHNGLAALAALCANAPETINDGLTTAPSKRLITNIPAYDKVNDGAELASLIGLPAIRHNCPRFDAWITQLEHV
jgi:hypothetical protein